jgi:hypothetical protein
MRRTVLTKLALAVFSLAILVMASDRTFGAVPIVILNNDQPNVGFNDSTPVTPVGNNTGTTLGQQRLNAFQFAANVWGATLNSNVTITIRASWAALNCTASTATLGSAGAVGIFSDFPNAPNAGTWYSAALANSLSGTDLNPSSPEINAQFNLNLGNTGCLDGTHFYLGLDNNHGSDVDLVTVLMHEFAHGLGYQTFTNTSTGAQAAGSQGLPHPSIYDNFLFDDTTSKTWIQMTDAERQASAINTGNLVWNGAQTTADLRGVLGTPRLRVNAPSSIAGNYLVGTADFGPHVTPAGTTGGVTQASPNDGCAALTNAAATSGRLALIDRGNCTFVVKVKNAQNAGAIGVIIANNVTGGVIQMGGGDATITIPTLMISQADGTTLKGQLSSGLNATLLLDNSALGGADSQGRALMFAPNPLAAGSSVSHWDTSLFPNQLMEPNISGDLNHIVAIPGDLTGSQLRDVGWSYNPIGDVGFYVRQHYLDFLNRQPDSSGLNFWMNDIFNCGIDGGCVEVHRINVSAAFFLSIEFQQTGNLVYKMYKAGFGNINPPTVPVPVRRANFVADTQQIQNTPVQVIVGQGNWQTQLESNKQAFALAFVQRSAFQSLHAGQSAADYVNSLFNRAGVTPTSAETNAAVNAFNTAGGGDAGRAAALRSVADSNSVSTQLFNESFVLMQYFGYLQRDPDSGQDKDFSGYNFWLNKLNQFNGNYINAEMVKAFITSIEYRQRFGPN